MLRNAPSLPLTTPLKGVCGESTLLLLPFSSRTSLISCLLVALPARPPPRPSPPRSAPHARLACPSCVRLLFFLGRTASPCHAYSCLLSASAAPVWCTCATTFFFFWNCGGSGGTGGGCATSATSLILLPPSLCKKKTLCPFYVSTYTGAAVQRTRMWNAHAQTLSLAFSLRGAWVSAPARGLSSRAWPAALAWCGPRRFVWLSLFFAAPLLTGRVVVGTSA